MKFGHVDCYFSIQVVLGRIIVQQGPRGVRGSANASQVLVNSVFVISMELTFFSIALTDI